jgi:6-phospho-beta-glucosidase
MIDKFVVIGGSSPNTPELVEMLLRWPRAPREILLVGRRVEPTACVTDFCRRLAASLGAATHIAGTTDARAALDGATHVLNMVRVGGLTLWQRMQQTLAAHGFTGHARFYGGAAMHLPCTLALARDLVERCPQAWMLQFTNPCGLLTEAIAREESALRVLSVCPGPQRARRYIARLLQQTDTDLFALGGVEMDWIGFNHAAWITGVTRGGVDVLGEVAMADRSQERPRWPTGLFERFGCLWEVDAPNLLAKRSLPSPPIPLPPPPPQDGDAAEAAYRSLSDPTLTPTEALSRKGRHDEWFHCIAHVLQALDSDRPSRFYSSVNASAAAVAFPGRTVELSVQLSARGVVPERVRPLKSDVVALARRVRDSEVAWIQAILAGDRDGMVEALALHPVSPGPDHARAAVAALSALGMPSQP